HRPLPPSPTRRSSDLAIVADLVHRNPGGRILAYHCCQADTRETLRPGRFVRSLAAMIASQLDGYAARPGRAGDRGSVERVQLRPDRKSTRLNSSHVKI